MRKGRTVTAEETKRRIRKVHRDMDEVIVTSGALAVLARSVQDVNETLSIHAAWTEERFDKVDERFDKVDQRLVKIDERFVKVDERFDKIDERFEKVDERFEKVDERFNRLEATMSREFHLLNLRLDQVISFATKSELGGGISGETSQ